MCLALIVLREALPRVVVGAGRRCCHHLTPGAGYSLRARVDTVLKRLRRTEQICCCILDTAILIYARSATLFGLLSAQERASLQHGFWVLANANHFACVSVPVRARVAKHIRPQTLGDLTASFRPAANNCRNRKPTSPDATFKATAGELAPIGR